MVSELKEQYEKIDKFRLKEGKYEGSEVGEIFNWTLMGSCGRMNVDVPTKSNIKDRLLFHGYLMLADCLVTCDKKVLKMNNNMDVQRIAYTPSDFLNRIL